MSDTTGPPFWLRPVWSSSATCRPSISAATPITWLTVTTPVPPIPIIRSVNSSSLTRRSGSRSSTEGSGTSAARSRLRFCFGGMTVRNDGQSPSRHEKSLLHDDWWIWVLRPNSVSTGITLRQPDLCPQSPQPSHTRSLMWTCCGGSSSLPRLRLRRFSAAHS